MLLRGMHDHGCDDIHIIVTDLKRQEMDDVARYFRVLCESTYHRFSGLKPSVERQIELERKFTHSIVLPSFASDNLLSVDIRLTNALNRQRRTPCFPQIDLTFRALLYEKVCYLLLSHVTRITDWLVLFSFRSPLSSCFFHTSPHPTLKSFSLTRYSFLLRTFSMISLRAVPIPVATTTAR
jgi:hypothetical protein